MTRTKRIISLLLALLMTLSMVSALAQETAWDEDRLNAYLNTLAEESKDSWQKAIYQAGAENLTLENDVLTFYLRGFAPNLKSLPKQTEDPKGWLTGFFANISEYGLEASLTLADGEPAKQSVAKLKTAVKNAAASAKKAFGQQTVKTALMDLLFPTPYKDAKAYKNEAVSPAFTQWMSKMGLEEDKTRAFSALMYAQSGHQMNLAKGPHALEISFKSTAPDRVLAKGEQTAFDDLTKVTKANAIDSVRLMRLFNQGLLDASGSLRKSAKDKLVFSVDVDELAQGSAGAEYDRFLQAFTLASAFDQFESRVRDLPDFPALDYPKNGRISGSTSGTKIVIKIPKDGSARYVQFRSVSSGRLVVDLFIRPGGKATVRVPPGMCYVLQAIGKTWYGEEALFGKEGRLSRTQDLDIKSVPSNAYFVLTLGGVKNGTIKSWGADLNEFSK